MKNFFRITTVQGRIVAAFAIILFLSQMVVLLITTSIITKGTIQEVEQDLVNGEQLFSFLSDEFRERLAQQTSILASDFAFRQTIATSDLKTVQSTVSNHRARLNADLLLLTDLDHKVIVDTSGNIPAYQLFPYPELLAIAEQQGRATSIIFMNGHLYHIVIVPVLGPGPVAWITAAFVINNNSVRKMQALIGLELFFVSHQKSTGKWQLIASDKTPMQDSYLLKTLANVNIDPIKNPIKLTIDLDSYLNKLKINRDTYLSHLSVLSINNDITSMVLIQQSLSTALLPLYKTQQILLLISVLSFLIALFASKLIAGTIVSPIKKLAHLADSIRYGDYSKSLEINSSDEIGKLASAFQFMREGIKSREMRISTLANFDPLTELPNRNLFIDRVAQAINLARRNNQSVIVMIMDLNRFKEITQVMGHQIGDLALKKISERLKAIVVNDFDTLARLGGDEFGLLLDTNLIGGISMAVKLGKEISRPIFLENQEIMISASIGITGYPDHADNVSTLMRYADLAMYDAKIAKLDHVVFNSDLNYLNHNHLSLLTELHRAILNQEFTVHYQPKENFSTGEICHVEALIRWIHPERGIVPPADFIPYSERTGFIKEITLWLIEQVLTEQKILLESGTKLIVAINISAHDLFFPQFPTQVGVLIEKYGLPTGCLMFEITESAIMANVDNTLALLHELNVMGIKISIDDFGTGYSSLAYLKKLPVSELKIDRSFVCNMTNDNDDFVIVRSTIELAHNMGLQVVAEGIEEAATFAALKSLGCDLAQGYYICKPLPIVQLINWIKNHSQKGS